MLYTFSINVQAQKDLNITSPYTFLSASQHTHVQEKVHFLSFGDKTILRGFYKYSNELETHCTFPLCVKQEYQLARTKNITIHSVDKTRLLSAACS